MCVYRGGICYGRVVCVYWIEVVVEAKKSFRMKIVEIDNVLRINWIRYLPLLKMIRSDRI